MFWGAAFIACFWVGTSVTLQMKSVAGIDVAAGLFALLRRWLSICNLLAGVLRAAGVVSKAVFGKQLFACSDQCIVVTCLSRTIFVEKITALSKYFSLCQCCYFLICLHKGGTTVALGGALVENFLLCIRHAAVLLCEGCTRAYSPGLKQGQQGDIWASIYTATSEIWAKAWMVLKINISISDMVPSYLL